MSPEKMILESELRVFENHRREWLRAHLGKFVVIGKGKVAGFFDDYESALQAGLQKFGLNSEFLVKQVAAEEPVYLIH